MNIDNFQELEVVNDILTHDATLFQHAMSYPLLGLRVNPQVGGGSILETSTATSSSKFGIPINEYYDDIMQSFTKYPFLQVLQIIYVYVI